MKTLYLFMYIKWIITFAVKKP